MDDKIIEFTSLLRQNGLRVSMAENIDSFHALQLLGFGNRAVFKDALRATMVKRAVDAGTYDELFDLYFTGLGEIVKSSASSLMGQMQLDEADFQRLLDALAKIL